MISPLNDLTKKRPINYLSGRNKAMALTICHQQTITNTHFWGYSIESFQLFFCFRSFCIFVNRLWMRTKSENLVCIPACTAQTINIDTDTRHQSVLRIRAVVLSYNEHLLFSDRATQYWAANTYEALLNISSIIVKLVLRNFIP